MKPEPCRPGCRRLTCRNRPRRASRPKPPVRFLAGLLIQVTLAAVSHFWGG